MAMKETVRSITIYFIVSGILGCLSNLKYFVEPHGMVLLYAIGGFGFLVSAAFLVVGIMMKKLLTQAPGAVIGVICFTGAGIVLTGGLLLAAGSPTASDYVFHAGGLAICAYLLANVRRLSREAQ